MAVTMQDVLAYLTQDEVDYAAAQQLGPQASPFLMDLVHGEDAGLASKAAYLASLIGGPNASQVVLEAAAHPEPVVRVAAASGIRNLVEADAARVLDQASNDTDAGVRKVAVRSAATFKSPELAAKVQHMAEQDPEPFVRNLAATTAREMR